MQSASLWWVVRSGEYSTQSSCPPRHVPDVEVVLVLEVVAAKVVVVFVLGPDRHKRIRVGGEWRQPWKLEVRIHIIAVLFRIDFFKG